MSKLKWQGGTLLGPLPAVLVSCGTLEKPNVLTIAWTGIINTKPPKTYVSIRPERHSYNIIKESGELVINLTTEDLVRATDFCGVRSGKNSDKFALCNLTADKSFEVAAPSIAESPLSLECRVSEIIPLGSHDMFLCDIVSVSVKEELINKDGKLQLDKAKLISYLHGEYFSLGKKLGSFGYSVKKRKKNKSKKES